MSNALRKFKREQTKNAMDMARHDKTKHFFNRAELMEEVLIPPLNSANVENAKKDLLCVNRYKLPILVWGKFEYVCSKCGCKRTMSLQVGVEKPGKSDKYAYCTDENVNTTPNALKEYNKESVQTYGKEMSAPFSIVCPECHDLSMSNKFGKEEWFTPRPVKNYENVLMLDYKAKVAYPVTVVDAKSMLINKGVL
jgi:hypothetical protein